MTFCHSCIHQILVLIRVWRSVATVKTCLNCGCLLQKPRKRSSTRNLHNPMLKSNWQPLKSSQRSILLNIFSNDLDNGTEFVGGTKLDRTVVTAGGRDLEEPQWAGETLWNHVKFNKGKCKVLHMSNPLQEHRLGTSWLESSSAEKGPMGLEGQEHESAVWSCGNGG